MDATGITTLQEVQCPSYVELKCCALCRIDLPMDCFGDNANRRDKKSPYCKPCNMVKTNESRARKREMKTSIAMTLFDKRRCHECRQLLYVGDMSEAYPDLCIWCSKEVVVVTGRPIQHFPDKDLTIADLSSMAQQGKKTLRRIPRAWRVS